MKHSSAIAWFTGLAWLHAGLVAADTLPEIQIRDAWIREAPPNAQVLAGYAQIENTTGKADSVVAVSSAAFEKAEIHRSEVTNNVARMAQIKELALPPHQIVKLEAGGTHVMLFNPKSPLSAGQHVTLNFTLRSGKTLDVDAEVRNTLKPAEHEHHH